MSLDVLDVCLEYYLLNSLYYSVFSLSLIIMLFADKLVL